MKNLIAIFTTGLLLSAYSFTSVPENNNDPGNNNQVVGKAKAALKQQCDHNSTNGQLDAEVTNVGQCYEGNGSVKEVIFTKNGVKVGTVVVDCNNDVTRVICGG